MNRRRYKEPAPERYQVLEYLENTGGQYISTDILSVAGRGVQIEFGITGYYTDNLTRIVLINTGSPLADGGQIAVYSAWQDYSTYFNYGNINSIKYGGSLNEKVLCSLNFRGDNIFKIGNVAATQKGIIPSEKPFVLFQLPTRDSKNRIYNVKFSVGSDITNELIPVRRMSDNELGMYDRVSGKFYTNRGTGTFIAGNATGEIIGLSVLPSEYQAVEYLESTGTQYIDTGIKPTRDKWDFDITAASTTNDGRRSDIIATNNPQYLISDFRFIIYTYTPSSSLRTLAYQNITSDFVPGLGQKFNVKSGYDTNSVTYLDINNIHIGNGEVTFNKLSTASNFLIGHRLYWDFDIYSYMRFYSVSISKNDEFLRYFIPCKRRSDNKPGMYDTVNNKFYTNAGTGEFLVGADIDLYLDCDAPGELGYDNPQKAKFIGYKKVEDTDDENFKIVDRLWDYKRGWYKVDTGEFYTVYQGDYEILTGGIDIPISNIDNTFRVDVDFTFTSLSTGYRTMARFYNVGTYAGDRGYNLETDPNRTDMAFYKNGTRRGYVPMYLNERHVYSFTEKTISIDGQVILSNTASLNYTNFYAFRSGLSEGIYHSVKIYKGDTLIADIKPYFINGTCVSGYESNGVIYTNNTEMNIKLV